MLFYYFSTEQHNWLIASLGAIFCGQFLTLVVTLMADIDLINLTPPLPASSGLLSSVSTNFESAETRQKLLVACPNPPPSSQPGVSAKQQRFFEI
jgi:hypothetical protein